MLYFLILFNLFLVSSLQGMEKYYKQPTLQILNTSNGIKIVSKRIVNDGEQWASVSFYDSNNNSIDHSTAEALYSSLSEIVEFKLKLAGYNYWSPILLIDACDNKKKLFLQSLVEKIGMPGFLINAKTLTNQYINSTKCHLTNIFKGLPKTCNPYFVMLDGLDEIMEYNLVPDALCDIIDEDIKYKKIIFIITSKTQHIKNIRLRSRINAVENLEQPNLLSREKYIKDYLEEISSKMECSLKDNDIHSIAKSSNGFSILNIRKMLLNGIKLAKSNTDKNGQSVIDKKKLLKSVEILRNKCPHLRPWYKKLYYAVKPHLGEIVQTSFITACCVGMIYYFNKNNYQTIIELNNKLLNNS